MDKPGKTQGLLLLALIISHLGWVMEMLLFKLCFGIIADRGFLTLPFCPIYGATVLAVYFLIGTPQKGGILLNHLSSCGPRAIIYFSLAALIPTASELVFGEIMEKISGRVLWDYSGMQYNLGKYISLESSLTWGALITGVMLLFEQILDLIDRVDKRVRNRIVIVFISAIITDFLVNVFLI